MSTDYIPQADLEFNAWQENFMTYAAANLAALGLVAGDLTGLTTAQTKWTDALAAHATAQIDAASAKESKNGRRAEYIALIRPLVRRLQDRLKALKADSKPSGLSDFDPVRRQLGDGGYFEGGKK